MNRLRPLFLLALICSSQLTSVYACIGGLPDPNIAYAAPPVANSYYVAPPSPPPPPPTTTAAPVTAAPPSYNTGPPAFAFPTLPPLATLPPPQPFVWPTFPPPPPPAIYNVAPPVYHTATPPPPPVTTPAPPPTTAAPAAYIVPTLPTLPPAPPFVWPTLATPAPAYVTPPPSYVAAPAPSEKTASVDLKVESPAPSSVAPPPPPPPPPAWRPAAPYNPFAALAPPPPPPPMPNPFNVWMQPSAPWGAPQTAYAVPPGYVQAPAPPPPPVTHSSSGSEPEANSHSNPNSETDADLHNSNNAPSNQWSQHHAQRTEPAAPSSNAEQGQKAENRLSQETIDQLNQKNSVISTLPESSSTSASNSQQGAATANVGYDIDPVAVEEPAAVAANGQDEINQGSRGHSRFYGVTQKHFRFRNIWQPLH